MTTRQWNKEDIYSTRLGDSRNKKSQYYRKQGERVLR